MKKQVIVNGEKTRYWATDDGLIFNENSGKEIKGTMMKDGYLRVQLLVGDKYISLLKHRVIAETFCEKREECDIVDHINHIRDDNRAENLRWVTPKQNSANISVEKKNKRHYGKGKIDPENLDMNEWIQIFKDDNYYVNRKGDIINIFTKNILAGTLREGYVRIRIHDKYYSAHKIVWEAFKGKIPDGYIIDHIDGNRTNNCIENLRIITQSENAQHSYDRPRKGATIIRKCSPDGQILETYSSIKNAAASVNKSAGCLSQFFMNRKNSRQLYKGYIWLRPEDKINT